jgi:hypothetical protein
VPLTYILVKSKSLSLGILVLPVKLRRFDLRMKQFSLGYGPVFLLLFEIHMNVQDNSDVCVRQSVKPTKLIQRITALKRQIILYKLDSCLKELNRGSVGSKRDLCVHCRSLVLLSCHKTNYQ